MSQLAAQKDRVHIGAYVDRSQADELARLARGPQSHATLA